MLLRNELKADLGGPWAMSLIPYAVLAPSTIISVVLLETKSIGGAHFWKWLFVSATAYGAAGILILICHKTLYRKRSKKPKPWWLLPIVGFAIGAFKGAFTGVLSYWLNLDGPLSAVIQKRWIVAGILGSFVIVGSALVVTAIFRLREQRSVLLADRMQSNARRMYRRELSKSLLQNHRKVLHGDFGTVSDLIKSALNKPTLDSETIQLIAEELRNAASQKVRPLSHELWMETPPQIAGLSVKDLLVRALSTQPFQLAVILPLIAISAIPETRADHDPGSFLIRLVLLVLSVALVLEGGNRLVKRVNQQKVLLAVICMLVAGVAPSIAGSVLLGDLLDARWVQLAVLLTVWLAVLAITSSLIVMAIRESKKDVRDLEWLLETDLAMEYSESYLYVRHSREIAKYLHGNLQSRLMATALAIENTNRPDEVELELERARDLIGNPFSKFDPEREFNFLEEINSLKQSWDGILAVGIETSGDLQSLNEFENMNLTMLFEEALLNASRHGMASEVKVSVEVGPKNIYGTAIDNGIGPQFGEPALGSALFNAICGSSWQIYSRPEGIGTVFAMEITRNQD